MTLFKPLPPAADENERAALADAIGSFVSQMTSQDQLLVGIDKADAAAWQTAVEHWRSSWPAARIEVIERELPLQCPNPKIAWLQVLAPAARGAVWCWSDADITAPSGFLDEVCGQLMTGRGNAVTAPYRVRHIRDHHGVFDALFVNLEFLPGALLLSAIKQRDLAYGGATVFRAETFHTHGDWQTLGDCLADDHKLGELLQPVELTHTLVSTATKPATWGDAWQHYYRWQKTVRWCRPIGFASLAVLMPALGWTIASLFCLPKNIYLCGLAAVLLGEILVGSLGCWLVGCRLPPSSWPGLLLWPVLRITTWLAVWLPFQVRWSGHKRWWSALYQS